PDEEERGQQVAGDGDENDCHHCSFAYPRAMEASTDRAAPRPDRIGARDRAPDRRRHRQPNCRTSPWRSNAAKSATRPSLIALTMKRSGCAASSAPGATPARPDRLPTNTMSQSCPVVADSAASASKLAISDGALSTHRQGERVPPS